MLKNLFVEHPKSRGQTYCQHLLFAIRISSRLALSAFAFALHGICPSIPIPRQFNLEATVTFLQQKNQVVEKPKELVKLLATIED